MGNCLVTKLKESVTNSDLIKLGHLTIQVNNKTSETAYLIGKVNSVYVADSIITGDGKFSDNIVESKDSRDMTNGFGSVNFSAGTYTIDVLDKYNIFKIEISTNGITLNSKELEYLTSIGSMRIPSCNIVGNTNFIASLGVNCYQLNLYAVENIQTTTDDIKRLTNLIYLYLTSPTVTGKFSDIVNNCKALKELAINGTTITGDASILLDDNEEKALPECNYIALPNTVTCTQETKARLIAAGYTTVII